MLIDSNLISKSIAPRIEASIVYSSRVGLATAQQSKAMLALAATCRRSPSLFFSSSTAPPSLLARIPSTPSLPAAVRRRRLPSSPRLRFSSAGAATAAAPSRARK